MVLALALAGLAAPGLASAELLQAQAEIHVGGAGGRGISGARVDDAFHAGAQGVSYGALVGVEVLFVDIWVEHNQYLGTSGLVSTWTQFMVGLDTQLDVGEKTRGVQEGEAGGYTSMFAELGMAAGFGVGTGQQVEPPLDNSQVTDKGFLFQVSAGLGYRLTPKLSVGVRVPVQAAYLFKSGDGAANDTGTHYTSVHGAVLLNARVQLTL